MEPTPLAATRSVRFGRLISARQLSRLSGAARLMPRPLGGVWKCSTIPDSLRLAMSLHSQLHDLLERVAAGLRRLPGATALYLFGSLTTPQADAYADIDLQLVTADFSLTQADWPYVLERIQPIDIAWPITPMPDNTAFAVLFQDTSYYH